MRVPPPLQQAQGQAQACWDLIDGFYGGCRRFFDELFNGSSDRKFFDAGFCDRFCDRKLLIDDGCNRLLDSGLLYDGRGLFDRCLLLLSNGLRLGLGYRGLLSNWFLHDGCSRFINDGLFHCDRRSLFLDNGLSDFLDKGFGNVFLGDW
ncbi:hypothetical protein C0991_009701 [Blastosporella zonata]|nr:hypothetical protein C0991_009701 [Blastosporella zonata]